MSDTSNYTPHGALNLDDRRRRLVFRAWHRGIKELDLIFGNFIDLHIAELNAEDCEWFEAIFEENDHEVLGWITGPKEAPEAFETPWMERLRKLDFMMLSAK